MKRILSLTLAAVIALSMLFSIAGAEDVATFTYTLLERTNEDVITGAFTDAPEQSNWKFDGLNCCVVNEVMNGHQNKLRPDDKLTRAEMAAMMVRVLRAFGDTTDVSKYIDIALKDWFYSDIQSGVAVKIIEGSGNKMMPNDAITREQSFAILARTFAYVTDKTYIDQFSDGATVSDWAKADTDALIEGKVVLGDASGTVRPKANVTRAEFAIMLYRIIKNYTVAGTTYDGILFEGGVVINDPTVSLKNCMINGDLFITDAVDVSKLDLENVIVNGRIVVRSGDVNLKGNSSAEKVVIASPIRPSTVDADDTANIDEIDVAKSCADATINADSDKVKIYSNGGEVKANGNTDSVSVNGDNNNVDVANDVKILEDNGDNNSINAAGKADDVTVNGDNNNVNVAQSAKEVNVNGNDNNVSFGKNNNTDVGVKGNNNSITLPGGAKNVTVDPKATGNEIDVPAGQTVEEITAPLANTDITGEGNVKKTTDNSEEGESGNKPQAPDSKAEDTPNSANTPSGGGSSRTVKDNTYITYSYNGGTEYPFYAEIKDNKVCFDFQKLCDIVLAENPTFSQANDNELKKVNFGAMYIGKDVSKTVVNCKSDSFGKVFFPSGEEYPLADILGDVQSSTNDQLVPIITIRTTLYDLMQMAEDADIAYNGPLGFLFDERKIVIDTQGDVYGSEFPGKAGTASWILRLDVPAFAD